MSRQPPGPDLLRAQIANYAAPRLVLSRAAEAGDARAAFMLAETYDPLELAKLGERGLAANLSTARIWYAKAHDLGWKDAAARLEKLPKDVTGDH
jgi:TPR repeat protein